MAKTCKPGYYWCYTDKKCKKIPVGWHVGRGGMIEKDDEETKKNNGNGESSESNGENGGGVSESMDGKSAKDKGYSLRDWFKGGGWVQTGGKYDGKPCAKQPGQKTKPFCRDADDRAAMSKDERNRRAAKKRKEDPNPNRKGKAKMVSASYQPEGNNIDEKCWVGYTQKGMKKKGKKVVPNCVPVGESKLITTKEAAGEKDACYKKVKSRYDVWPSAYASGALSKCRKVGAKNWGNKTKKEEYEFSDWRKDFKAMEYEFTDLIKPEPIEAIEETVQVRYCPKCQKDEAREECAYGPRYWDTFSLPSPLKKTFESVDPEERDEVCPYCSCDPCECEGVEIEEAVRVPAKTGNIFFVMVTWRGKGYSLKMFFPQAKRPTRKEVELEVQKVYPGGRVRYMEIADVKPGEQFLQVSEGAAWTKKAGKSESGGLNEKGRKSYERENPGSDLKAPSKKVGNKRRASFCARMKGMKKKLTSAKTANDPDSRINKSLRAWNC